MAQVEKINDSSVRIKVELPDAITMVEEAARDVHAYAYDIVTMCDKMPAFDYTSFCFYAYDTSRLFELMLGMSPREYTSFSLDAPDCFFYTLYGGMKALYQSAKAELAACA